MTLQLTVPNMACSACSETIVKAIRAIDPAATIQADPKSKQVLVDSLATTGAIKQAITNAGYTVE